MVKPVQRFSFNISAPYVFDWTHLHNTLVALNPTTALVMNSIDRAKELKRVIVPQATVSHRQYIPKDGEKRQYEKGRSEITRILDGHERDGAHDVLLHVLNEPDRPPNRAQVLDWEVQLMQDAKTRGIRCLVDNGGTDERAIIESGAYDDFYIAAADGDHRIGRHEYAPFIVMMIDSAGRLPGHILDPDKVQHAPAPGFIWWPAPDDVNNTAMLGNFSINRHWWDVARMRHLKNIGRTNKVAKIIMSERGVDRKPNIESMIIRDNKNLYQLVEDINESRFGHRFAWPYTTLKGQNTWGDYVSLLYDGKNGRNKWNFDTLMLENCKWLDWTTAPEVEGDNWFTWAESRGNQFLDAAKKRPNPEWNEWVAFYGHGMADRHGWINLMIANSRQLESATPVPPPVDPPPPTPEPPPVPAPADNAAAVAALEHALGALAVAKAALAGAESVVSEQIGKLKA